MTVRFEDLVLEPAATLRQICAFLHVDFSVAMLGYGSMVEEKIPEDKRWLWPAISRPPQHSKVGHWRQLMTRRQRVVF